jgi:hypothetical protein
MMQSINMLLLAIMAFVISLTSAAALASTSVSNSKSPGTSGLLRRPPRPQSNHTPTAHPTSHHGSYTGSINGKYKPMTGWGEWSGKPSVQPSLKPTVEPSMTETGASTTSTIHTTETEIVTARDDDHKSTSFHFGPGGLGPVSHPAPSKSSNTKTFVVTNAHTFSHHESITDTMKPTGSVSYAGTKSFTKTASGMTTVTMAAREDAADEGGCTPVFFKGGDSVCPQRPSAATMS